ncbi:amino acid ABC transporter permease [Salinibacterium sp. dk2585]|uniref:amino acid ABC transporter permease n=1 Tax=unclassified Salinibacterium TaxID=2632331 RepID=UPI0011C24C8B|nr:MULTISPECIES: amino acid ABC transporter permease [unclassified Salinibacterium]QEE61019.1 amino acid ABC transporter permease [Salinibacterium sp. dk2585]TXK52961.1 amino acid ABC transporter permease [Salinibacterium sp. dk5596]
MDLSWLEASASPLFQGMCTTLLVFFGSIIIATVIGVLVGALRLSRSSIVRGIAWVYVEFFRGVSVIVLIFWAFFVLPLLGIHLSTLVTSWLVIGLNQSAFIAEIVRGGIQAVPRGQIEASIAINLSPLTRLRNIVFPQALPIMLPPYANQLVNTLKETAVVSLIGLADLTFSANELRTHIGHSLEMFLSIGIIYLLLAYLLTQLTKWLETKTRVEPLRGSSANKNRRLSKSLTEGLSS